MSCCPFLGGPLNLNKLLLNFRLEMQAMYLCMNVCVFACTRSVFHVNDPIILLSQQMAIHLYISIST